MAPSPRSTRHRVGPRGQGRGRLRCRGHGRGRAGAGRSLSFLTHKHGGREGRSRERLNRSTISFFGHRPRHRRRGQGWAVLFGPGGVGRLWGRDRWGPTQPVYSRPQRRKGHGAGRSLISSVAAEGAEVKKLGIDVGTVFYPKVNK